MPWISEWSCQPSKLVSPLHLHILGGHGEDEDVDVDEFGLMKSLVETDPDADTPNIQTANQVGAKAWCDPESENMQIAEMGGSHCEQLWESGNLGRQSINGMVGLGSEPSSILADGHFTK